MKLKDGPLDGAQPRNHVLAVLRRHGVSVEELDADFYELVDVAGFVIGQVIYDPVPSELIVMLWRRFGPLHGFEISELVRKH